MYDADGKVVRDLTSKFPEEDQVKGVKDDKAFKNNKKRCVNRFGAIYKRYVRLAPSTKDVC